MKVENDVERIVRLEYENAELKKSLMEQWNRVILLRNRINFMLDNRNEDCKKCIQKSSQKTGLNSRFLKPDSLD